MKLKLLNEITKACQNGLITKQAFRTLKGQILKGDVTAAKKGYRKLIRSNGGR